MKRYYDFEMNKILNENELKESINISLTEIEEILSKNGKINIDAIINRYIRNGSAVEIDNSDIIEIFDEDIECMYNGIWYGPGVYICNKGRLYPVY